VANARLIALEAEVVVGGRRLRLVAAVNEETVEVKYFVTNALNEPPSRVLAVAFRRATIEHNFRLAKGEAGLTHYEGRQYVGLVRHLVLGLVVLGFVSIHTDRLRGEKPGGNGRAGVPGATVRGARRAEARPRDRRAGVGAGGHHLPPAPQPGCNAVQTEARRSTTRAQKTEKTKAKTISRGKVAL